MSHRERSNRPLRIVFCMLHPGYVRNYEGAVRILLDRGHKIHLAFMLPAKQWQDRFAERLANEYSGLTFGAAKKPKRDGWRNLRWLISVLADHARYLHPRYREANALRERVVEKMFGMRRELGPLVGGWLTLWVWTVGRIRSAWVSDVLVRTFLGVWRALPTVEETDRYLEALQPDVVLVTPHVTIGSYEAEYAKSALAMGVPTALCVASWDNLTNKGMVKLPFHRVVVWNSAQISEGVELHHIPVERMVMTGAQRFDEWFEQSPRWTREDFCSMVGLDPDKPFILYLCSSPFIAENEPPFVEHLIGRLRGSDSSLREAGVLVRPHPQNAAKWVSADLSHLGNVTIWPRAGEQPVDDLSRASFYDSIHHSVAVVGINTSAQIEAGIIGRTVHTVTAPEFASTQEGTLHFRYLLVENGGLLHVAPDVDALVEGLEAAVQGLLDQEQTRRFVESFVRPFGLDVPSTPILAEEIERVGDIEVEPASPRPGSIILKWALTPLAVLSVNPSPRVLLKRLRPFAGRALARRQPSTVTQERSHVENRGIRDRLRGAAKGDVPVIVGPWLQDASLELLYWVPFLRWALPKYAIAPERVVVISRGGNSSWYEGLGGAYLDLFEVVTPGDLRAWCPDPRDRRLSPPRALEDRILGAAREAMDPDATLLRPSVLRYAFGGFWTDKASQRLISKRLDLRMLRTPQDPDLVRRLPESYVAVQIAFTPWLPRTSENLWAARELISRLAESSRVLLLGSSIDDGAPVLEDVDGANVMRLWEGSDPYRNLHAHSVAVSRARAFVGTHGGMASLAISYGIDTLALFSDPTRLPHADIDLTYRLANVTAARYSAVDIHAANLLERMLPSRPVGAREGAVAL